jgi:hypothetical protein
MQELGIVSQSNAVRGRKAIVRSGQLEVWQMKWRAWDLIRMLWLEIMISMPFSNFNNRPTSKILSELPLSSRERDPLMEGLFLEKKLRRPFGLAAEVAEPDMELECEGCRIIMDIRTSQNVVSSCLGILG